jgi:hypothetical protein
MHVCPFLDEKLRDAVLPKFDGEPQRHHHTRWKVLLFFHEDHAVDCRPFGERPLELLYIVG